MKGGSEDRQSSWNSAHLLPWQDSQSRVMLWRLRWSVLKVVSSPPCVSPVETTQEKLSCPLSSDVPSRLLQRFLSNEAAS